MELTYSVQNQSWWSRDKEERCFLLLFLKFHVPTYVFIWLFSRIFILPHFHCQINNLRSIWLQVFIIIIHPQLHFSDTQRPGVYLTISSQPLIFVKCFIATIITGLLKCPTMMRGHKLLGQVNRLKSACARMYRQAELISSQQRGRLCCSRKTANLMLEKVGTLLYVF